MLDSVVQTVPIMEIPKGKERMIAKGLKRMAVVEAHQVTRIQMMTTTMVIVEMMTPQMVMVILYQVAATPNAHKLT